MYEPGTPTDDFDVSDHGIVFTAADRNVADPTKTELNNVYHIPLDFFSEPAALAPTQIPLQAEANPGTNTKQGLFSHPRFGPRGMVAFMRAPASRPSDVAIYIKHVDSRSALDVFTMVTGRRWHLVPSGFEFSTDGHSFYVHAHDCGRTGLYKLELKPNAEPKTIIRTGTVSAYYPLRQDKGEINKLLVTSSSLVEPWIYQILDADMGSESEPSIVSRSSKDVNLGLSPKQVSEIYFEGGGDYVVQAWVVTPRDFEPSRKKYPLCLLVHGGPNGAWEDAWSTRVSFLPQRINYEFLLSRAAVEPSCVGRTGLHCRRTQYYRK
jgi:hypothetical protein